MHNSGGAPVSLQVSGNLCSAFEIWRVSGTERTLVTREVSYAPTVCSFYLDASATATFELLEADATRTLVWDAREDVVYPQTISCAGVSNADAESASVSVGVAQPVEAGAYEAVFVWGATPDECSATPADEGFHCWEDGFTRGSAGSACADHGALLSVPFVLPTTGDLTVPVELPALP